MEYLVRFAHVHESFRLPELHALAALESLNLEIVSYERTNPFGVIRLDNEQAARSLIRRSILARGIFELWGSGVDYTSLHEDVRKHQESISLQNYIYSSFRFKFDSFQGKRSSSEQRELVDSFQFLDLRGPIRMTDVDLRLQVFEHFERNQARPNHVYLGRWVADGSRDAAARLDLKTRRYIGQTSMDAELSLVTANLTHAAPGKIMYDPFVGTGSFSVACAHFGALTLGSDIDGRTIRGSPDCSHASNYKQYNLASNFLDNFVADLTNTPLRIGPWLDCIVCDPPYGVREGPKILGYRDDKDTTPIDIDGVSAYMRSGYIPPKRPYSFDDMLLDVLDFSAMMLVPNGRVSMWMPTANDDDVELAIPTSPGLEMVSVCVQQFNKWARRLLTYRRVPEVVTPELISRSSTRVRKGNADDLNRFRKKYFQGFRDSHAETA